MAVRKEITAHEIARRRAGFTVTALARRIGVSHTYVSRVECGEILPSPRYSAEAARLLGLPEGELFDSPRNLLAEERAEAHERNGSRFRAPRSSRGAYANRVAGL